MISRDFLEIKSTFNTAAWKYFEKYLQIRVTEIRKEASRMLPVDQATTVQRDSMFAQSNAFENLVNEYLDHIHTTYNQLISEENK